MLVSSHTHGNHYFFIFSAPDWFDDEWISKIRHDTGDNRRLKVKFMTRMEGYAGHPVLEALCYYTMDGTDLAFDWSGQVCDYSLDVQN